MEAVMGRWNAWAGRVGDGLVDFGTPLAGGVRVTPDGTAPSTREVAGYSIIESADMDAALELAQAHPHLTMPGGCEIEVHEARSRSRGYELVKMPTATDADKERFRSLVAEVPGVEVKPMFGQLGAFVNGNMFAGLFGATVGVTLEESAAAELYALPGAGPFGPAERPMGGYLSLPEQLGDDEAAAWVDRAREHVSTFPPKQRKA